jgi:hypothetical protein
VVNLPSECHDITEILLKVALNTINHNLNLPSDHHDITEILMKVALNTINHNLNLPSDHHDITEILMKVALNTINHNHHLNLPSIVVLFVSKIEFLLYVSSLQPVSVRLLSFLSVHISFSIR